jgi:tetratricopeptide (TPR) repeat protein
VAEARLAELRSLGDRSLVRFDPLAKRYRLHPLIRLYAEGLLTDAGEAEGVGERHARYYLARLMEMVSEEPEVRNGAARRLRPETDNIVVAWRWAVAQGWGETLVGRGHALQSFFDVTVRYPLGAELLREAEIVVERDAADRAAHLRACRAFLTLRIGDNAEARALAISSMDVLGCDGASLGCWIAATVLGAFSGIKGDLAGARERFELALTYVPDRSGYAASTLVNLGMVAIDLYQTSAARTYLERALDIFRTLGRTSGEVDASRHLAITLLKEGEARKARDLATVAARKAQALGNEHRYFGLHRILAQAHLDLGDLERAEASAAVHLDWVLRSGLKGEQALALSLRGRIHHAQGEHVAAREDLVLCLEASIASGAQNTVARFILESYDMMATSQDAKRAAQLRELLVELMDIEDIPASERQRIDQILSGEGGGRQSSKRAAAVPLTIREACERAIAIMT